ncbi:MAG TPA: PEP-CTERM sorting domain-containing protein [Vicinamibacterales bacterium]|nr:PEP-CTERM sorting domain-containing protein [Vicinamibacterales bacterium]
MKTCEIVRGTLLVLASVGALAVAPPSYSNTVVYEASLSGAAEVSPNNSAGVGFLHAVPEAQTYALLVAGLGLIVLAGRRRFH